MRRSADVIKLCGAAFCAGAIISVILPAWLTFLLGASVLILCLGANS